jgi:hypothetical protein
MERRMPLLTGIAFIGLCLVGMGLGVQRMFWPPALTPVVVVPPPSGPTARPVRPVYAEGEAFALPGVSFAERDYTLVLVTQKGCTYCDQSMPFYQTLGADAALAKRTRIVLVAPDAEGVSREELQKYGVRVDQVVQLPLGQLKVTGTPTAIVVNRDGVIERVLPGMLDPARQTQLLSALGGVN